MIIDKLREAYYQRLEENLVHFTEFTTLPDGSQESIVKTECANADLDCMCDYLGMPDWVKEWTLDLIKAEAGAVPNITEEVL